MSADADSVYSATLLVSLVAGGLGLAAAVALAAGIAKGAHRAVGAAAVAGWACLLVSLAVHLGWGHTPGTPRALPPVAFLREHVAFLVAALLPALALAVRARSRSRPEGMRRRQQ